MLAIDTRTLGTSLQGFVRCSYDHVVKTFGEPTQNFTESDRKMNMRWVIEFPDGVIATLYDCYEFTTAEGLKHRPRVRWHIGGKNYQVVPLVCNKLKRIGESFK